MILGRPYGSAWDDGEKMQFKRLLDKRKSDTYNYLILNFFYGKGITMLTVTESAQTALKDYFEKQNLNSPIRVFLSQGG
jgi:hypothetical protein